MTSQKFYFDRSTIVDSSANVFGSIFVKADDDFIDIKDILQAANRRRDFLQTLSNGWTVHRQS